MVRGARGMKQFAGSQHLLLSSAGLSRPAVMVSQMRHGALPPRGVLAGHKARGCLLLTTLGFYSFLAFICLLHSSSPKPGYYQAYFIQSQCG